MAFDRRRGGYGDRGGRGYGGFRDRGGFSDLPKPVKVGEEFDVEINEVGSKGDGIARVKNFVVFVSGAKTGEKIKIKITGVMGRFATAEKVGAAEAKIETETTEVTEAAEKTEGTEEVSEPTEGAGEETVEEAADVEEVGESEEE